MIHSFKSIECERDEFGESPYGYANEVAFIKGLDIEFSPGLNIVFGPNGSGKSTLIGSVAWWMAATQGGDSTVTNSWSREIFVSQEDGSYGRRNLPFEVKHDGQPITYIDPRVKPGLVGGMAAFDDDFFTLGVQNLFATKQKSTGQQTLSQIGRLMEAVAKETAIVPEKIKYDVSGVREEAAKEHFGESQDGRKTIILDEPEAGLSLVYQNGLWINLMRALSKDHQVIVATHSPFALSIIDANYIETEEGIVDKSKDALNMLFDRISIEKKYNDLMKELAGKKAKKESEDTEQSSG